MTPVDFTQPPSRRRVTQPPLLSSLLVLSAALSVWAACAPTEPGDASGATAHLPLDARQAVGAMESALAGPPVSYELEVSPSAPPQATHDSFAVAGGNGIYLVVWREYGPGEPDILGVRVRASDGQWLDASPLPIATDSNPQFRPAVAFDGTNFLVVWEEPRSSTAPRIYGTRVRASDGALLDATPLYLSRARTNGQNMAQQFPAVAFDGTNYLVTWHGYAYPPEGYPQSGVQAIRVRPSDGACLEPYSIMLGRGGSHTRVAYADGHYLVTWKRGQQAEAARISAATGQVVDATPIALGVADVSNNAWTGVAAQGGEFLATWLGAGNALWARRIRASDGARLGTEDIAVGTSASTAPELTFDGKDYQILWEAGGQVLSARVSRQGVPAAEGERLLAEVERNQIDRYREGSIASAVPGQVLAVYPNFDPLKGMTRGRMRLLSEGQASVSSGRVVSPGQAVGVMHNGSAAAVGNGIYLVVWSEQVSGEEAPDILGVRVRTSDGARLDARPLRISSGAPSADYEPAVAFDGTNFLVVWQGAQLYGARVRASDGAVLDSTPLVINRPLNQGHPVGWMHAAVAFDGTNYLVTWHGYYQVDDQVDLINKVWGSRIRTDGTFVEPAPFAIAPGGDKVRVAYADGHYLVAWMRDQNVEAARVSAATGQVLDTPPISLAASGGSTPAPAVAARRDEFLVTWIGGDKALRAQRLRASDGARLNPEGISVAPSASGYPEVTFDGLDYRIAWQDSSAGVRRLLSRRVSSQGVVAAEAELMISEVRASTTEARSAIAAADRGQFLIAYPSQGPYAGKNRIWLRLVREVQAPEPCTSGVPSLVLNGDSPMVLECGPGGYRDPGAQAFDGCGNPVSVHAYNTGTDASGPGPLLGSEGSYSVAYAAWDAQGQTVNAVRTVEVNDSTAPVLQLLGPVFMTHTCGSQWVDPGVQAMDACYGDVSAQVGHTGEVNGWAVGTYTVTYWLTDSGGNSAVPVSRTVQVLP
jgi:hypothetical protein